VANTDTIRERMKKQSLNRKYHFIYQSRRSDLLEIDPFGDAEHREKVLNTLNARMVGESLHQLHRYLGHRSTEDYSCTVAAHSVYLTRVMEVMGMDENARKWALLHDVPEMIFGDIPAPLKPQLMTEVAREAEAAWERDLFVFHGIPTEEQEIYNAMDRAVCMMEFDPLEGNPLAKYDFENIDVKFSETVFEAALQIELPYETSKTGNMDWHELHRQLFPGHKWNT